MRYMSELRKICSKIKWCYIEWGKIILFAGWEHEYYITLDYPWPVESN